MTTIKFLNDTYQISGTVTEAGAMLVSDLSGPELVKLHNLLNSNLGIDKQTKKFADRKTGVKRVIALLEKYDSQEDEAPAPEPKKAKAKAKAKPQERGEAPSAINFLGMRVDIKAQDTQVELKRKGSARSILLPILLRGATLEELTKVSAKFDAKRGFVCKNPVRRTYEIIRIFCYHYGYGTQSSEDGKTITLVTK